MKFLLFLLLLTTLFDLATTSLYNQITTSNSKTSLAARQLSVESLVAGVLNNVLTSTTAIKSAITGLSSASTAVDNATAAAALNNEFIDLTTVLKAAISAANTLASLQPSVLGSSSGSGSGPGSDLSARSELKGRSGLQLEGRQIPDAGVIVADIKAILSAIVSTLRVVLAGFDLENYLPRLNPLLFSVLDLLVALVPVVDGLSVVVSALYNTLLVGLSAALVALG